MENHNIDSQFRKAVNESPGYYETEAEQAKGRIWHHIQTHKKMIASPNWIRSLVAACILLFIFSSIMSILFIREKKSLTLVEANRILKENTISNNQPIQPQKAIASVIQTQPSDTVFIEKKVIINRPVIRTEKLVDTVYVQQLVFIEKEPAPEVTRSTGNIKENESVPVRMFPIPEKEILISNREYQKQEKKGKLRFKLGRNNNSTDNGSLAFTLNL